MVKNQENHIANQLIDTKSSGLNDRIEPSDFNPQRQATQTTQLQNIEEEVSVRKSSTIDGLQGE